jgi:hypothetical protein
VEADAESEVKVENQKKKKMKKKKMLRHNPEVKTVPEKMARYDDHSIDSRIEFIQQLLDDNDIDWSKDDDFESVQPATDRDFMSVVEKRAEDQR